MLHDGWSNFLGMEYPGFVLLNVAGSPVVHEVAHQWWYGIIGNNEYADPWLDEAFATYATDVHEGNHRVGCWPTTYAQSHWYGVATPAAFKTAAQAVSPTDLKPFWTSHNIP
ncbi:hypothetical protein [Kribbella sp. NPDC050469]|uniref:hypothetical protein n=1 Tax=Kribbella sp. NPDC050469 TaxID=3364116 RepID=UPI0037BB613A